MSSLSKNLNQFEGEIPKLVDAKVGILVSEWNKEVTSALLSGAIDLLKDAQISKYEIHWVPGSFELIAGSNSILNSKKLDAVITLGCVIQGETRHFDFICDAVANGLASVGIKHDTPIVFGVLTTDNQEQAMDRAGGKHGNKGTEAAYTAVKMIALNNSLH